MIHSLALNNDYEVKVSAVVKMGEESPELSLTKEMVEWMCEIGARLDIDMYLHL